MKKIEGKRSEYYLNNKSFNDLFPKQVLSYAYVCECAAGETLVRQGQQIYDLYYLVEGRCSIHTFLSNGKKMTLSNVSAPALIGEIELLDLKSATFSVRTLEDSVLIVCPLNPCRDILLNDNRFLRKLCVSIIRKEERSAFKAIHASGFPLKIRIADFILDNREGSLFRMKKVQMAELLGASYRHVETIMASLVNEGYLKKEKLIYRIIDEKRLAGLAEPISRE